MYTMSAFLRAPVIVLFVGSCVVLVGWVTLKAMVLFKREQSIVHRREGCRMKVCLCRTVGCYLCKPTLCLQKYRKPIGCYLVTQLGKTGTHFLAGIITESNKQGGESCLSAQFLRQPTSYIFHFEIEDKKCSDALERL